MDKVIYNFIKSKNINFENKWLKKKVNIRASIITKRLIGKYFLIHDGFENTLFQIQKKHLFIKLGQLILTRLKPIHNKKKGKK